MESRIFFGAFGGAAVRRAGIAGGRKTGRTGGGLSGVALRFLVWRAEQISEPAQFALESGCIFEFACPESCGFPSVLPECAVDGFCASDIVLDFIAPECLVGFGKVSVFWASVPEAAVDKDGGMGFGKDKIGFAEGGEISSPAGDFFFPEDFNKQQFGAFVARRADTRHDPRAFFFGKNIGVHSNIIAENVVYLYL